MDGPYILSSPFLRRDAFSLERIRVEIYNTVYLGVCGLIPLGMAFLAPSARFLLFWILLFLVPREFNVRLGSVSLCLTDMAFLGWVFPELVAFWKEGWNKSRLAADNGFAWAALGLFLSGTIYHWLAGGIGNPRFFLKDLMIYGTFPVVLLALRRSGISWKPLHLQALSVCSFLMAATIFLVAYVPAWRVAYHRASVEVFGLGRTLGYFIPGIVQETVKSSDLNDPYYLRIWNFIGGIPLGMFFPLLFPALLAVYRPPIRKSFSIVLFLAFLFYGVLFEQSRTIFTGVFVGLFSCIVLFKDSRKTCVIALAAFILLSVATPVGCKNWARYKLLENKELEGIYAPKSLMGSGGLNREQPVQSAPEGNHIVYDSRFPIWLKALSEIKKHPFAGLGPGSVLEFPYGRGTSQNTFVDSVYVTFPLKWGLGALVLFLAWLAQLALKWRKAWPWVMADRSFQGEVLRGFPSAALGFLFLGIFYFPMMNVSFSMFLAAFLGLSLNSLEEDGKTSLGDSSRPK